MMYGEWRQRGLLKNKNGLELRDSSVGLVVKCMYIRRQKNMFIEPFLMFCTLFIGGKYNRFA